MSNLIDTETFVIEQYKTLRSEMMLNLQRGMNVQRNGILLMSAVYALLFAEKSPLEDHLFVYFVPPIIAAFTEMQRTNLKLHRSKIGSFIFGLEREAIAADSRETLGWEHYVDMLRRKESPADTSSGQSELTRQRFIEQSQASRLSSLNSTERVFWISTCLGSLVFAAAQLW